MTFLTQLLLGESPWQNLAVLFAVSLRLATHLLFGEPIARVPGECYPPSPR